MACGPFVTFGCSCGKCFAHLGESIESESRRMARSIVNYAKCMREGYMISVEICPASVLRIRRSAKPKVPYTGSVFCQNMSRRLC
jgi:hypothetical protein